MVEICPTITADNPEQFRHQMQHVGHLSRRMHIDLADGSLAPRQLLPLGQVWWPEGKMIDLHVMTKRPVELLGDIVEVKPHLAIVHAEAEGDFANIAKRLHEHDIKAGVAILPDTDIRVIEPALQWIDHVLIFSGNFGYQGGAQVNFSLLSKVSWLKQAKHNLEIGWDGGVSPDNATRLAASGIAVLNVGSTLQRESNPHIAYAKLITAVKRAGRV